MCIRDRHPQVAWALLQAGAGMGPPAGVVCRARGALHALRQLLGYLRLGLMHSAVQGWRCNALHASSAPGEAQESSAQSTACVQLVCWHSGLAASARKVSAARAVCRWHANAINDPAPHLQQALAEATKLRTRVEELERQLLEW
eukprot:TRINITY_DN12262_c0_g1_i1.p2 TRINITY_DN12262_c0_g1~~TRINITY_DN12262_c0_g1_i1.p2  ORF type:complete len:144 (+),score=28.18 TRINITY_DN12262_c0_g1_i1:146-577(+)